MIHATLCFIEIALPSALIVATGQASGAWAGLHPWIVKGEQSGLVTYTATTESVTLCVRMKN